MGKYRFQYILPRKSSQGKTFATVTGMSTKINPSKLQIFEDLKEAAVQWVRRTEMGTEAFAATTDFDIGALAKYTCDKDLKRFLKNKGISNLKIDYYIDDDPIGWEYNDVLVTDDDLITNRFNMNLSIDVEYNEDGISKEQAETTLKDAAHQLSRQGHLGDYVLSWSCKVKPLE